MHLTHQTLHHYHHQDQFHLEYHLYLYLENILHQEENRLHSHLFHHHLCLDFQDLYLILFLRYQKDHLHLNLQENHLYLEGLFQLLFQQDQDNHHYRHLNQRYFLYHQSLYPDSLLDHMEKYLFYQAHRHYRHLDLINQVFHPYLDHYCVQDLVERHQFYHSLRLRQYQNFQDLFLILIPLYLKVHHYLNLLEY